MNSRIRFCRIAIILSSAIFLISCGVHITRGEYWLASKTDKSELDVSGTWYSPEWGLATFKQEENRIIGTLGDYPAKGIVSRDSLYLMMYSGWRGDYFAELKAIDKNNFIGLYSKYIIIDEVRNNPAFTRPMMLTKGAPPPDYYYSTPPPAYSTPPSGEVTQPPATGGQVFFYPHKGQSQEQLTKDRKECETWAMNQSGVDLTKPPPTDMSKAQQVQKSQDYYRALDACMDGRGYTLR